MGKQLSIIIPVYNEEKIVGQVIEDLKKELIKIPDLEYEVITINDASTDKTEEILKKIEGINLISHSHNKGYGASLKTGIEKAKFNNLLFFDADGQHKTEYIPEMLKHTNDFDLISGVRQGYKGPIIRQPGKYLLLLLANYLCQQKIPDLNCGIRIVKKDKISKFLHLLCDGLSFSATTLLLFITEGYSIKYIPITINKRLGGKSTVKAKHAIDTLIFIIRTILLSNPLRIFLPVAFIFFIGAIAFGIYDLFIVPPPNISDSTILFFISSILIFFFGLVADQLAAIRKEIK